MKIRKAFIGIVMLPIFVACEKQGFEETTSWEVVVPDSLCMNLCFTSILGDKNNSIYIGTDRGLWCIDADTLSLIPAFFGLRDSSILEMEKNSKNELVILTEEGLYTYDGALKNSTPVGISIYNYSYMTVDSQDNIWLLSRDFWEKELLRLNGDSIQSFCLTNRIQADGDRFQCIFADSEDRIWVGATYGLYSVTNGKTKKYVDKVYNARFFHITEGKNGTLWLLSLGSIFSLTGSEVKIYPNPLRNIYVTKPFIDHNGDLWLSDLKSLWRFHNEKWMKEFSFDLLNPNYPYDEFTCFEMFEDSNNTLWVFTNRGIMRSSIK